MRALTLLEVAMAVTVAVGVGMILGLGAALIAGGVLGVLACEWASARLRTEAQR